MSKTRLVATNDLCCKKCLQSVTNIDYPIYSYDSKNGKLNCIELTDELEAQIIQSLKTTNLFYWPEEYDEPIVEKISSSHSRVL